MSVLDTNLLIRLATGDVPSDRDAVVKLIEGTEVRVPKTVLLEAEWVLRSRYGYVHAQVLAFFEYLAGLPTVNFEDEEAVRWAMGVAAGGLEFADALHLSLAAATGESFHTFDKALHRKAAKIKGVRVRLLRG